MEGSACTVTPLEVKKVVAAGGEVVGEEGAVVVACVVAMVSVLGEEVAMVDDEDD